MVLVDSSVWIDYLGARTSAIDQKLETLIHPNNQVVITGLILQEVLQGIRNERSYQLTQKLLRRLPLAVPNIDTHILAAEIFRDLFLKGKTCSTIDAVLAALAIENRILLFTLDADFHIIQRHSDLKLFS